MAKNPGIRPLYEISEAIGCYLYKNILETVMLPFAKVEMPTGRIVQHYNDPKPWIQDQNINV